MDKVISHEFAVNPDPRSACLLLLDASSSMSGEPIAALNEAVRGFVADVQKDSLSRRLDLGVVVFGGDVRVVQPFAAADKCAPQNLVAEGTTPLGAAVSMGIQMVKHRKADYRTAGVPYYRPWVLMISDGEPTDEWEAAAAQARGEAEAKGMVFFAVGVGNSVNMEVLNRITERVVRLEGLKFRELFQWLSVSQRRVSASRPGEPTPLPPVTSFAASV